MTADIPKSLALSFSSCAWLFTYHLGVIKEVLKKPELDQCEFLGASSGSIAALAGVLRLDMDDCLELALEFGEEGRKSIWGPFGKMSSIVRNGLLSILDPYAYLKVKKRFLVSVTKLPYFKNRIISANDLKSNQDLVDLVLASCYIPFYYENTARFKGRLYLDGGFSNPRPRSTNPTVVVSPSIPPKNAPVHICPRISISKADVLFPNEVLMKDLYQKGSTDFTLFWLQLQQSQNQRPIGFPLGEDESRPQNIWGMEKCFFPSQT